MLRWASVALVGLAIAGCDDGSGSNDDAFGSMVGTVTLEGTDDFSGVEVAIELPDGGDVVIDDVVVDPLLTAVDGRFALEAVPAGEYEVVVSKAGYDTVTETVEIIEGGVTVVEIALELSNRPPVIEALSADPEAVLPGGTSTLLATASDPDDDTLTWAWTAPDGWTLDGDGPEVTLTAPDSPQQSATIEVVVSDEDGLTATSTVDVTTLARETCDDGVLNQDETDTDCGGTLCDACDDGATCADTADCTSGVCTDGTCAAPTCDDGVVNQDETDIDCGGATCDVCDDGGTCAAASDCASGVCDAATGMCAPPDCGDGVVQDDEVCDDGNAVNGDGCSTACFIEDGGTCTVAADCASGVCDVDTCEPADTCGNGIVDAGEACDDSDTADGDGCSAACLVEDGGTCASASDCASGICDVDTCEPADTCGNGVVETGESCDDSGTVDGDGCSAACLIEDGGTCANAGDCASGICDTTETPAACEPADTCGNGTLETGEVCDDGNTADADGCSSVCLIENGGTCANAGDCASGVCDTSESPAACEPADTCGNGVLETDEVCDDGNTADADGCSAACLLEDGQSCTASTECTGVCDTAGSNQCEPADVCGNGTLETGEVCDDGNTADADGCSAACLLEDGGTCANAGDCASGICDTTETPAACEPADTCGNGTLETGEVCDDGNTADADGCSATCLLEDGQSCTASAECTGVCDTAGSNTCEPADTCGNGTQETGEACDDGNVANTDGCSSACLIENGGTCASNDDCVSNVCDANTCEAANVCGNGVVETGESCDDSGTVDGDGCSASCFIEDGSACTANGECASGVCDTVGSNTCEPADTCGNGALESGEVCDDGNATNGDGCSAACLLEDGQSCTTSAQCVGVCDTAGSNTCEPADVCGNGTLETGESCDDGNTADADGCSSVCLIENGGTCANAGDCASGVCDTSESPAACEPADTCGNGVLETGESCDDGNTAGADGCSASCLLEDGQSCTASAECTGVCDTVGSNTCEPANVCGNGTLEGSEVCDDGNTANGDGCSSSCLIENGSTCAANTDCVSGLCDLTESPAVCEPANTCGNSVVDAGEACDDGNTANSDGCSSSCLLEDGQSCTTSAQCTGVCDTAGSNTCEPADVCGNGALETGESCDDGNTADADGCSSVCLIENGGTCANAGDCASGVCDASESPAACEPADTCGNGVLETGESCDDGNTAGADGCSSSCLLEDGQSCTTSAQCTGVCDTAGSNTCEPANVCGNGTLDAGEACDDGNLTGADGCSSTCLLENGGTCASPLECASGVCDLSESPAVCEPANTCGNGALEGSEGCDDGGNGNGDGCSAGCLLEDGQSCTSSTQCVGVCDTADSNQCEPANVCGNGTLDVGEACDDGNSNNTDGCTTLCDAPNCSDGFLNQDETGVDCGGTLCAGCNDGSACQIDDDCANAYCNASMVCASPTCFDGARNQDESDVDCGGATCFGCGEGQGCDSNADCQGGSCTGGFCDATCSDLVQNQDETGVDCGGACAGCQNGDSCVANSDCLSGFCDTNTNACTTAPTLCPVTDEWNLVYELDLVNNANWDVPAQVPYAIDNAGGIARPIDGVGYCIQLDGQFVWATMDDFTGNNPAQTGIPVDWIHRTTVSNLSVQTNNGNAMAAIGGAPLVNATGGNVEMWSDQSTPSPDSVFNHNDTPINPADSDGSFQLHYNGNTVFAWNSWSDGGNDEGGLGNSPGGNTDWTNFGNAPGYTIQKELSVYVRFVESCTDGLANQDETDRDCGGSSCCPCQLGQMCNVDADCQEGSCLGGICSSAVPACQNNALDGDETDVDCGGGACAGCQAGQSCSVDSDCRTGLCVGGTCSANGDGSDGALTINSPIELDSDRAQFTASSGQLTGSIANVVGIFQAGDLVLLHQSQSGCGAGLYEYARLTAVNGTDVTFGAPLANSYITNASGAAQMVRVMEFTTVQIDDGGNLMGPLWDGQTGGILAFVATDAVTVAPAGLVQMDGAGFRGDDHADVCPYRCGRGYQGESFNGVGVVDIANNASGGGGGGRGQDNAGGGGGGHSTTGTNGINGNGGNCSEPGHPGGAGGAVSIDNGVDTMLFGGAGGEGGADEDGAFPGGGGNGGGLIVMRADTVAISGAVRANGTRGSNGVQTAVACGGGGGCGMGGGGGGAGGIVRIEATSSADLGNSVATVGGGGGNTTCGPALSGGTGGVGYVVVGSPAITGSTNPAYSTLP